MTEHYSLAYKLYDAKENKQYSQTEKLTETIHRVVECKGTRSPEQERIRHRARLKP